MGILYELKLKQTTKQHCVSLESENECFFQKLKFNKQLLWSVVANNYKKAFTKFLVLYSLKLQVDI